MPREYATLIIRHIYREKATHNSFLLKTTKLVVTAVFARNLSFSANLAAYHKFLSLYHKESDRQQLLDKRTGHQVFNDVEYTKDERKHPHEGRFIPQTEGVNHVLELAKNLAGTSEYVFHDKKGKPISKSSYMLHLRRACDRLGITTRNNHAFRVAFNSRLIELGLPASERALLLGHAVQTNERYYSVYDRRSLNEIRKKLK